MNEHCGDVYSGYMYGMQSVTLFWEMVNKPVYRKSKKTCVQKRAKTAHV